MEFGLNWVSFIVPLPNDLTVMINILWLTIEYTKEEPSH